MTTDQQGGDGFGYNEYQRIAKLAGITDKNSLDKLGLHFYFYNASKPTGETHKGNIDRYEFFKLMAYIEDFSGQDVFKNIGGYPTQGDGALDFISFQHTSGGFNSNKNPDYDKAAELKDFIQQMWYDDPDFRDFMAEVRRRHPKGFKMELVSKLGAAHGEALHGGNYVAIRESTFNNRKGDGLLSVRSTIVHEIFHTLGLHHVSNKHLNYIASGVPGVHAFERASKDNNVFWQAINGKDDGLTPESYNFRNPNNTYDLDLGSGDKGIYGGS